MQRQAKNLKANRYRVTARLILLAATAIFAIVPLTSPAFADYDAGTYGADAYSVESQTGTDDGPSHAAGAVSAEPGAPNTSWGATIPFIGPAVARIRASSLMLWIAGGMALGVVVGVIGVALRHRRRAS